MVLLTAHGMPKAFNSQSQQFGLITLDITEFPATISSQLSTPAAVCSVEKQLTTHFIFD